MPDCLHDKEAKLIERHVTFEVFPDKTRDFEKLFVEEYRPAMVSMPGYVKVDLLREQENPNHYQMVIRFLLSLRSDCQTPTLSLLFWKEQPVPERDIFQSPFWQWERQLSLRSLHAPPGPPLR